MGADNMTKKLMGLFVALVMVVILFPAGSPVLAEPGNSQWTNQAVPGSTGNVILNNSGIIDIALERATQRERDHLRCGQPSRSYVMKSSNTGEVSIGTNN